MKKSLALMLAAVMIFSFCGCANVSVSSNSETTTTSSASSAEDKAKYPGVELKEMDTSTLAYSLPLEGVGIRTLPDYYDGTNFIVKGLTSYSPDYALFFYKPIPLDGMTVEEAVAQENYDAAIYGVLCFNNNLSLLNEEAPWNLLYTYGVEEASHEIVTTDDGGYVYYAKVDYSNIPMSAEAKAEVDKASNQLAEIAKKVVVYTPQLPKLSFTTVDMNGKTVTAEELFGKADITMVNFFTSWCVNCALEMEELLKLSKSLEGTGKQVILCICDAKSPDDATFKEAEKMIADNNGTGLYIICMNDDFNKAIVTPISAYPTNFIVDKTGQVLSNNAIPNDRTAEDFTQMISEYSGK